jgi:hypothetical protein
MVRRKVVRDGSVDAKQYVRLVVSLEPAPGQVARPEYHVHRVSGLDAVNLRVERAPADVVQDANLGEQFERQHKRLPRGDAPVDADE